MKCICFFTCLVTTAIAVYSQPPMLQRQLKMISVSGNGYERGLQHGTQLKKEIGELMVLWKKSLEQGVHMPADTFIRHFMAATNFIPAIKKYTPDILDEVRGIAKGANQDFTEMLAYQLVDEYWVYADKLMSDPTRHHCSGIGVPAMNGRPAYVSQNMDLETWMDGYQTIIHIQKNGNTPEQYILSCAGLVALNGMNEHNVGVCVNTLMQLEASTDGLPVAFVVRGLLAKKTQAEVLHFLQTTKHASGQNFIVGIADSVYDFEASGKNVVRLPADASGLVYHTNHPVVNRDIKPWYIQYYNNYLAGSTQNMNSEVRLAALSNRAKQASQKDDSFIKNTLRSKDNSRNPVCRTHLPDNGGFTFASIIISLSGKGSMQVTAGPPDESEYQTISFGKH